jgi:PAS domain S-box-containing protein
MVKPMNNHSWAATPNQGTIALDAIDQLPVAYVEINADGVITRANRVARQMSSPDQSEIVGRYVWEFAPESQTDLDRSAFLAMMSSGQEPPVTRRTLYGDGAFRTYELHRTLIRDASGRPVGVRGATIDVTEAQIAQEEAHHARVWLESVMDSMPDAILTTDALGFIRSVNPALEALCGWKAAELQGKVIEKAFPLLSYSSVGNLKLSFNMALQTRSKGIATVLDSEGRELRVEISTSPVVDKENGYTIGVVSVIRRVSDGCADAATLEPERP